MTTKSTSQRSVYEFIVSRGADGATDMEMQESLGVNPNTQRPRRNELSTAGAIVDSGMKRSRATVWVAPQFTRKDRSMAKDKPRFESVRCDKIKCDERSRKDMGDLQPLADSILQLGLLHPIVITSDYELVCGERRLRATMELLHENVIDAKIVDLGDSSSVDCEHDENELRKAFTPSERVAIAAKRREQIGDRKGERTDLATEPRDNCPKVEPGKRTSEVVAELAGFDSYKTMERAAKVVESGCEELIDAMDAGTVSISRAATIAALPKAEQRAELAAGYVARIKDVNAESKKAVGALSKALAKGDYEDVGVKPHQKQLLKLYGAMKEIGTIVNGLNTQADTIIEAKKTEKWSSHTKTMLRETLAGVQKEIKQLDKFLK